MDVANPKDSQMMTVDERTELKDLANALKATLVKQEPDARTRFHEQFRKEADDHDRDFHKKYHDDLNTTLIFAGLFSAVASAFIVEIQSQLRPDYQELSFVALTMLLNATPGISNQTAIPTWSGPDPSDVQAQSIMFASLASALIAAFLATLGKQWLNLHVEGSFIDRNRHRELRMRGMITWKFKFVMECLPLIMQGSLLLLGYALGQYFWDLSRPVSSVIIGFTAFGVAFYVFIVSAATYSRACPFQTPVSIGLRFIIQYCRDTVAKINKTTQKPNQSGQGLPTHRTQTTPPSKSNLDEEDSEVPADSNCITTMFRMTKASESIVTIMAYIPEITWDTRMKSVPLLQVYQALRDSLWRSAYGKTIPRPGASKRALGSAKALLHLYVQRRCICPADEGLTNQVRLIDHGVQPLAHNDFDGDFDLQSTFYIVDWAFGGNLKPQIPWSDFKLSKSHHCWLGYILRYRAWDSVQTQGRLSDDVRGFLGYSLECDTLPDRVVADCLFIINMMVGYQPQPLELVDKDQSHQIIPLIDSIFRILEAIFKQSTPSNDITTAVEALSLVVLLHEKQVRVKSYELFRIIMGLVKRDDRLWIPARLSMKGAYSSTEWIPPTGDLKNILDFLHFHILQRESIGDEPIYHAFRSIVIDASVEKRRSLAAYDFGSSFFIDAITELLSNKDHIPLRRMSLLILPELDSLLFTSEIAFDDTERASKFVGAWSAAIGELLHGTANPHVEVAGIKILLAISNLRCLRVHIPPERWDLAYKFPVILYSSSSSMQRCTQNPDILPYIKQSAGVTGALGWLGMLWMKYHSLLKEVREDLEAETRAISSSSSHFDLDSYVSLFDSELARLRAKIERLEPLDRSVPQLRAELDAMARSKDRLVEIQKDGMIERQNKRQRPLSQAKERRNTLQPRNVLQGIFS